MRLRKDKNNLSKQRSVPPISRPEPYRYHAVRTRSDRLNDSRDPRHGSKMADVTLLQRAERAATFLVITVIAGSLLYLFWLDTSPRVRFTTRDETTAQRQSELLHELHEYETAARNILDNTWLSRTKLTINTDDFSRQLLEQFPELSHVTVTLPLTGHKPVVALQPKDPALLMRSNGVTYVVDRNGHVIALLSEVREAAQAELTSLPRVEDQSGLPVDKGHQVVTEETVTFILQLHHQYEQAAVDVLTITLPPDKPDEVRVTVDGTQYTTKYIVSRPAREQFGAYRAVFARLTEQGITPSEYIDVRVEGKVFYK